VAPARQSGVRAVAFAAFELPHFIMQRRMMLGIKERAERQTRAARDEEAEHGVRLVQELRDDS
jgi:hypothetical protein